MRYYIFIKKCRIDEKQDEKWRKICFNFDYFIKDRALFS